jgi:hypothetical protein
MTMKYKIVSALVYGITALDLANFFDSVYGAGPISSNYIGLTHVAIAGAILFAVACLLSLFNLRMGITCGLVACILSWPFFAGELSLILGVWRGLFSVVGYAYWTARLASVWMLIVSSIYSLSQLRLLLPKLHSHQS